MSTTQSLSSSEVGTVLYALRSYQRSARCGPGCEHLDGDHALTDDEIDDLCERLNLSEVQLAA